MADIVSQRNIGQMGDIKRLTDHATSTAGGTGDATSVTGASLDRVGAFSGSLPDSALISVLFEATLASGATLSVQYDLQSSPDNSTWTDYQTGTYVVAATGASGGSVVKGEFNVQVNLRNAARYLRFIYSPKCSSTGTDTTYSDGVGFFGGGDRLPSTNA